MSMVTPHAQRTVVSMIMGAVGASKTRRVHHKKKRTIVRVVLKPLVA
ncbi:MAG: hypothetical protein CM15mP79_0610 [Methanobacteriota archaeon]|nr:MAG: hypothetical protein CM15mP79_0610 [Euryarchaeota archaeon]